MNHWLTVSASASHCLRRTRSPFCSRSVEIHANQPLRDIAKKLQGHLNDYEMAMEPAVSSPHIHTRYG